MTSRTASSSRWLSLLVVGAVLAGAGLVAPSPASADIGVEGRSYSGTGTPTGTKRSESVMWFNDGLWWASMWDTATADFHIFRLDLAAQQWVDTGVVLDPRPNTHADVLWDGTHLYVASHEFVAETTAAAPGSPSWLFRYSYDASTKTYSRDPGFPAVINDYKTETLVIDKDSTGKLWATWMQDDRIFVNRTVGGDASWGTPFALPVAGNAVTVDDNSSLVSFGGRIGVAWSNQTDLGWGVWFAVHNDGDADTDWQPSTTAISGSGVADDHLSVKAVQADGGDRVYALVKTSHQTSTAPQTLLLVRDATGQWSNHPVSLVADCATRPMLLIDEENRELHVYETAPGPPGFACVSTGGAIYEKTSPLDAISFPAGAGTPVIEDSDSPSVNNVSSTKQNVNSLSGIALLAVNTATRRYWHAYEPIEAPAPGLPPAAGFSAAPTSGIAPLAVAFTDRSSGDPTAWSWSFGDGGTSTQRNPSHTYAAAGTYTVALTATNANGSDTESRTGYITVQPAPDFTLTASPLSRQIVRGGSTTYTVTATPTGGFGAPVTLSVSGLRAGTGAAFSPNPLTPPSLTASTLTVTTTPTAANGATTLVIAGTSGALVRTTSVSLNIKKK